MASDKATGTPLMCNLGPHFRLEADLKEAHEEVGKLRMDLIRSREYAADLQKKADVYVAERDSFRLTCERLETEANA